MKTPEEYLQEVLDTEEKSAGSEFTDAEIQFMKKYLGLSEDELAEKLKTSVPEARVQSVPGFAPQKTEAPQRRQTPGAPAPKPGAAQFKAPPPGKEPDKKIEEELKHEERLQLVSFTVNKQEYAIPILAVQEVVRSLTATEIPEAPPYMAGIVNLRGRITPLIKLNLLLGSYGEGEKQDLFTVVCRHRGLQVGLLVDSITTMYHVPQKDIEWGMESRLGINVELLSGLMKIEGKLIGIISVDRLVDKVLKG